MGYKNNTTLINDSFATSYLFHRKCSAGPGTWARVRRGLPFIARTLYKEGTGNLIMNQAQLLNPVAVAPAVLKISLTSVGQNETFSQPIPLVQSMTYEINGNGLPIKVKAG